MLKNPRLTQWRRNVLKTGGGGGGGELHNKIAGGRLQTCPQRGGGRGGGCEKGMEAFEKVWYMKPHGRTIDIFKRDWKRST